MPLIDIQTNLKSLTYGDFGSSDPLVTKDINNPPNLKGIALEGAKRVDDLQRISKLLTSTPAALKFVANQAMLNVVEQNILSANREKTGAGKVLRGLGGTAKMLASTLAQVPVSGTGLHFVEGFSGKLGYLKGVRGHIEYKNNRRQDGQITTQGVIEKTGDFEANNSTLVLEYFSESQTPGAKSRAFATTEGLEYENSPKEEKGTWETRGEGSYYSGETSPKTNTKSANLTLSGVGFNENNVSNDAAFDSITFSYPKVYPLGESEPLSDEEEEEDLIKFNFKIISPGESENAKPKVTVLKFRAFLDSFTDDYSAEWNSFKYIGRAEDFHTYQGFGRTISFGFKVAALSKKELTPLYNKLNLLVGSLAPSYVGSSFMRGNFVGVTIGDYLINQTGFFSSVGLSWNNDYQFGGKGEELPTVLDVTCAFTPIHKFNTAYGGQYINNVGNTLESPQPIGAAEKIVKSDKA